MDEQDTRQNIELKKSVVQSVSLCLSYLFLYILTSMFIKKKMEKKIKQAKKIKILNFAESNAHRKTNARGRFDRIYIFSLNKFMYC